MTETSMRMTLWTSALLNGIGAVRRVEVKDQYRGVLLFSSARTRRVARCCIRT